MEYRSLYSVLCWHSHAGLVGITGLPADVFDEAFAFAHAYAQRFYRRATDIVGDYFRVYDANPEIKRQVEFSLSKARREFINLRFQNQSMIVDRMSVASIYAARVRPKKSTLRRNPGRRLPRPWTVAAPGGSSRNFCPAALLLC